MMKIIGIKNNEKIKNSMKNNHNENFNFEK